MLTQNITYFSFCPLCLILLHLRVWFCLLYPFKAVFIHLDPPEHSLLKTHQSKIFQTLLCMRDVSHTKSPPVLFCGLGAVCACLPCKRDHKPEPSTHDASHQHHSPSCPNMFGNGIQNYLLHYLLRD